MVIKHKKDFLYHKLKIKKYTPFICTIRIWDHENIVCKLKMIHKHSPKCLSQKCFNNIKNYALLYPESALCST